MNPFKKQSEADLDEFDTIVGNPGDQVDELAKVLKRAGIDSRIVVTDDEAAVRVRADDVPRIQEALERVRRPRLP